MLCMRASKDLASMRIDAISTEISCNCPFISKSAISQYILDFGIFHLILHQLRSLRYRLGLIFQKGPINRVPDL